MQVIQNLSKYYTQRNSEKLYKTVKSVTKRDLTILCLSTTFNTFK